MSIHELAGFLSVFVSFLATALYVRDTLQGKTKPHAFTWLVWGLLMSIGAAVGFVGGAMVSGLILAAGGLMNFSISLLALKFGERDIKRSDWIAFVAALLIIPIWVVTKEPLTAAILAATIDTVGLYPTLRKAWNKPYEENIKVFSVYVATGLLGVLAITPLTLVTGFYPSASALMNLSVAAVLIMRRRVLSQTLVV